MKQVQNSPQLKRLDLITRATVENLARNQVYKCQSTEELDFDVVPLSGSRWTVEQARTKPLTEPRNVHISFPPVVNNDIGLTNMTFSSLLARCTFAKEHNRVDLMHDCELLETNQSTVEFTKIPEGNSLNLKSITQTRISNNKKHLSE